MSSPMLHSRLVRGAACVAMATGAVFLAGCDSHIDASLSATPHPDGTVTLVVNGYNGNHPTDLDVQTFEANGVNSEAGAPVIPGSVQRGTAIAGSNDVRVHAGEHAAFNTAFTVEHVPNGAPHGEVKVLHNGKVVHTLGF